MPKWDRIIVGDAFKLPSRNPRFYLDMILLFPTLLAGCWLISCFHGWRVAQWDLKQASLGLAVTGVLLVLIKERTVVIAAIFGFVAYSVGLHSALHGDTEGVAIAYLFMAVAVIVVVVGTAFRVYVLKKPDFDSSYHRPDRNNSWLGAALVLGLLFGMGSVGIYLAWHNFPGFPRGVDVGLRPH